MRYSKTERRIVRFRLAVLFAVVVAMFVSVIAMSAATTAAGAASPYDEVENSFTNEFDGHDVAYEDEHENDSTHTVRLGTGAEGNAVMLAEFSRDEGMQATLECESGATAVLTVEVLEGSYVAEGAYELSCGETVALPVPEEAVTLRITVDIEGEQYERVVEYDPEKQSIPDGDDEDHDWDDEERPNDPEFDERKGAHADGNASVNVHFNSDEGLTAQVECEGNVTAVVTIEVVEGSYAGEGSTEVTCGESIELPAPEEAVTFRITVEVEGEEHVHVIEYDPAGPSISEMVDEERDRGDDEGEQIDDRIEQFEEEQREAIRRLLEQIGESDEEHPRDVDRKTPDPEKEEDPIDGWNDNRSDERDENPNDERPFDRSDDWDGDRSDWDDEWDGDHLYSDCEAGSSAHGSASADGSAEADGNGATVEGSGAVEAGASASVECTTDSD